MDRITNVTIDQTKEYAFKKHIEPTLQKYVVGDVKTQNVGDKRIIVYFVKPTVEIVDVIDPYNVMEKLDSSARTCYCSNPPINSEEYNYGVVTSCIKNGHTSILEHVSFTFDICTNRAVLAELTRHRIASYSVESTRYCAYENKGFKFIIPLQFDNDDFVNNDNYKTFTNYCIDAAKAYTSIMNNSGSHDNARRALNNDLAVNIRCTFNIRSLRNFLSLRYNNRAHIDIREIAAAIYDVMVEHLPLLVADINPDVNVERRVPVKYRLISDKPGESFRSIIHTGNDIYKNLIKYNKKYMKWDKTAYEQNTNIIDLGTDIPYEYFNEVNDTMSEDPSALKAFVDYTSDILNKGENV